jgi:hypothetical protein
MTRICPTLATIVLGVCLALVGAAPAFAQVYPPTPHNGELDLPNGSSVTAGGVVDVAGENCGDAQSVSVMFDGEAMATATTDAAGTFTASIGVPPSTQAGTHTVTATNDYCELVANVTVTAAAENTEGGSELPTTGSGAGDALVVALLAVGIGVALVATTRRRQRRQALTAKDA